VVEAGQERALTEEARAEVRHEGGVDELERGALPEGVIGALGAVDGAHAAAPEQPRHAPRADLPTEERVSPVAVRAVAGCSVAFEEGTFEEARRVAVVVREQDLDLLAEGGVGAGGVEPGGARVRLLVERVEEERRDASVAVGLGHDVIT
jgi:hypothetical protein